MVEVILFHHAGGLTDGVLAFASALRDAGHTVRTPDLSAVAAGAADRFPTFVRVFSDSWTQREQLRFSLDLVISGLEGRQEGAGA
ncbi:hypothetical protein [Lysinimicrobium aestuarii]|uniref:hypothetical protein n=1 Tax=Demequina maris TaxID=1638982 RepID=UPI000782688A